MVQAHEDRIYPISQIGRWTHSAIQSGQQWEYSQWLTQGKAHIENVSSEAQEVERVVSWEQVKELATLNNLMMQKIVFESSSIAHYEWGNPGSRESSVMGAGQRTTHIEQQVMHPRKVRA